MQELFGFKRTVCLVLSSGLLVTFPAVTNTFAFLFTADGYFLAMLMASFAVLISIRSRKGVFPAALCFCLSLGMYQAYILYAIVLTLLYGIKCLLFDQEKIRSLFTRLVNTLAAGILGTALYYISLQILLRFENVALSDMNGLSGISMHNLPNPFDAVYNSLHDFIFFFFHNEHGITFYVVLNIFFIAALLLLTLKLIIKGWHSLGIARIGWSFLFALLTPFVIYLYYFASSVQYHTIMLESIALFYIFLLLFLEKDSCTKQTSAHTQHFLIILTSLIIYNFILTANIAYTNMAHSFERSTAVINRMADRIEQLEDFSKVTTLAIIGELPGSNETIYNYPPDLSGTVPNYIMRIPQNYVDMFRNYNNIDLTEASKTEITNLLSTNEYSKMDNWPAANSVQIIDHCVVIKLSEPKTSSSTDKEEIRH